MAGTPGRYLLIRGDARHLPLASDSVHCCATSPPFFGLRDYGDPRQIGLEPTPQKFVEAMRAVAREVWRVLREDGSFWLNLGDSFARADGKGGCGPNAQVGNTKSLIQMRMLKPTRGLKPKDLCMVPERVAFALQSDGWYVRAKPPWCLSGGTWLYAKTQKGEMPVMVKDLVRLDPSTIRLWNGKRWTQVLGWGRNPNPQEKIEIVLRSGERIGCTGDHLWPTESDHLLWSIEARTLKASELRVGDNLISCSLPEPSEGYDPPYLMPEALWFIGLYLAEGSRSGDMIQISGHADELHRIAKIEQFARHYGGSMKYTVNGNNLSIRVYGRIPTAIIESYIGGNTAIDKHLKVSAWALTNVSLRMIAEGYLEGDGHDDPENDRIRLGFCRNYSLERDLRTMAARLGAGLTLLPKIAVSQWGRFPSFRGEWRWTPKKSGHNRERDRNEIVEIRSSRGRKFWDISIEDEPHLFALASGVLTHNCKPNPMPDSTDDRPNVAHESIFLLTKNERYYFDMEAVRVPSSTPPHARAGVWTPEQTSGPMDRNGSSQYDQSEQLRVWGDASGRHLRTNDFFTASLDAMIEHHEDYLAHLRKIRDDGGLLLSEGGDPLTFWMATKSFNGAHFATWPQRLVEPMIKASTSERGCCSACGAPWVRIVEGAKYQPEIVAVGERFVDASRGDKTRKIDGDNYNKSQRSRRTTGWEPSCTCDAGVPIPCVVLDNFCGAGTTVLTAEVLGRRGIGLDLNADYLAMANRRVEHPHARVARPGRAGAPTPLLDGLDDES